VSLILQFWAVAFRLYDKVESLLKQWPTFRRACQQAADTPEAAQHAMVQHAAYVNSRLDGNGCTPMMLATVQGDERMVSLLLTSPELILEVPDYDNETAYSLANRLKNRGPRQAAVFKMLNTRQDLKSKVVNLRHLQRTGITSDNEFDARFKRLDDISRDFSSRHWEDDKGILMVAAHMHYPRLFHVVPQRDLPTLMAFRNTMGENALHAACASGDVDMVKMFLDHSSETMYSYQLDRHGRSPLMAGMAAGQWDACRALYEGYEGWQGWTQDTMKVLAVGATWGELLSIGRTCLSLDDDVGFDLAVDATTVEGLLSQQVPLGARRTRRGDVFLGRSQHASSSAPASARAFVRTIEKSLMLNPKVCPPLVYVGQLYTDKAFNILAATVKAGTTLLGVMGGGGGGGVGGGGGNNT